MPLFIEIWVNKKRKVSLGLNTYRNLHFQVSNNVKKKYKDLVAEQMSGSIDTPIWLSITYFNPTKRKSDLTNFCSIHDKFFSDALVELWYIEDDNYDYIKEVKYIYWWYDKWNWRVEIEIYSLKK